MNEQRKKAFDFAQDATKQLITLSTGVIALSVTFSKDVFAETGPNALGLLTGSWISFLVSVLCGAWVLMALTGELEPLQGSEEASIRGSNVTIPSLLQIATFLLGLLLTVLFGVVST